jgi:hypothetical protein
MVLNFLSARELAEQVGLVRATTKRHTAEGSTTLIAQNMVPKGITDRGD